MKIYYVILYVFFKPFIPFHIFFFLFNNNIFISSNKVDIYKSSYTITVKNIYFLHNQVQLIIILIYMS